MSGIRSLFCCGGGVPSTPEVTNDHEKPREAPSMDATDSNIDDEKHDSLKYHGTPIVIVEQQPPQLPEKMSLKLSFEDNRSSTSRLSRDAASMRNSMRKSGERQNESLKRISDEMGKSYCSGSLKEDDKEQELITHDWAQAVLAAAWDGDREEQKKPAELPKSEPAKVSEAPFQRPSLEPPREEEQLDTESSRFEAYSGFSGWATKKPSEADDVKPEEKSEEKPVATIIPPVKLLPTLPIEVKVIDSAPVRPPSAKSMKEAAITITTVTEAPTITTTSPVSPSETIRPATAADETAPEQDMSRSSTPTQDDFLSRSATPTQRDIPSRCATPCLELIESEFNPTRDPRRTSTISTISNIIAPAAAAAAIKRQSGTYIPRSRPASPSKRFSQLTTYTVLSRSNSVRSTRFSMESSLRPFSALSVYTTGSRVNTPTHEEETEDEDGELAALPTSIAVIPATDSILTQQLQPLTDNILPMIEAILASTGIMNEFDLWDASMTLKREMGAFISVGAEEFLYINDAGEVEIVKQDAMTKCVRGFIERGEKIKREAERKNIAGSAPGEGRLGKVRSFWMEKTEVAI